MKKFKKEIKRKVKLIFKALRKYVNNNDLEHKVQEQKKEIEFLSRERDFWKINCDKANTKLLRNAKLLRKEREYNERH